MKFNVLLSVLGAVSTQLRPASSSRYNKNNIGGIRPPLRTTAAAIFPFGPLSLLSRSSSKRCGGRRPRRRLGGRRVDLAGLDGIRAGGDGDGDDGLSRRGGASSVASRGDHDGIAMALSPPSCGDDIDAINANTVDVNMEVLSNHNAIAKTLKNRNHTNLSRKIWHAAVGLGFAALNQSLPRARFIPGMTILTSATLLMELLRYRKYFHWMNDCLHFVLGGALRKHEMEGKFTGSFYYFAGVTATAYLYPQTAATLAICQLALVDPSASFFGRHTRHVYWSRIEGGLGGVGRNKGVLGFLGGAIFCFPFNYRALAAARWGLLGAPGGVPALAAGSLLLGLAGAFADLAVPTPALTMPKKICGVPVPPFHMDDNFVVPIFSGMACTKIFNLLGWDGGLTLAKHIIF